MCWSRGIVPPIALREQITIECPERIGPWPRDPIGACQAAIRSRGQRCSTATLPSALMKDLQTIARRARELDEANTPYVLATVVQTSGSVYRGPGTRMLIEQNMQSFGSISGGCLEGDIRENSNEVFADGHTRLLHYDTTSDDDIVLGTGLGCSGTIDVLLERLPQHNNFHYPDALYESVFACRRGVLATIFAVAGDSNAQPGQHLILDEAGNASDDIADIPLRQLVIGAAREALTTVHRTHLPVAPGLTHHCDLSHSKASVLIEPLLPPIALHIFGAGYDAIPLAHFAGELGWRTSVADHRAPYARAERFPSAHEVQLVQPGHLPENLTFDNRSVAVIMTHNYLQDQALLAGLIESPLAYLGVLGPHGRTQRLLSDLKKSGVTASDAQLQQLFSPVGLDIGAETSEAIALSILAEIQAVLTGRHGGQLSAHQGPIHSRPQ